MLLYQISGVYIKYRIDRGHFVDAFLYRGLIYFALNDVYRRLDRINNRTFFHFLSTFVAAYLRQDF